MPGITAEMSKSKKLSQFLHKDEVYKCANLYGPDVLQDVGVRGTSDQTMVAYADEHYFKCSWRLHSGARRRGEATLCKLPQSLTFCLH